MSYSNPFLKISSCAPALPPPKLTTIYQSAQLTYLAAFHHLLILNRMWTFVDSLKVHYGMEDEQVQTKISRSQWCSHPSISSTPLFAAPGPPSTMCQWNSYGSDISRHWQTCPGDKHPRLTTLGRFISEEHSPRRLTGEASWPPTDCCVGRMPLHTLKSQAVIRSLRTAVSVLRPSTRWPS